MSNVDDGTGIHHGATLRVKKRTPSHKELLHISVGLKRGLGGLSKWPKTVSHVFYRLYTTGHLKMKIIIEL